MTTLTLPTDHRLVLAVIPVVYLIHFSRKIGNPDNPRAMAQHYVGHASDLVARIHEHRTCQTGAKILIACNQRGVSWRVVRLWRDTYPERKEGLERQLKTRYKNFLILCPVCNPNNWDHCAAHLESEGIQNDIYQQLLDDANRSAA